MKHDIVKVLPCEIKNGQGKTRTGNAQGKNEMLPNNDKNLPDYKLLKRTEKCH